MQPWLEDLSEDWIPQQASSRAASASPTISSSVNRNSRDLPSQPRSRLPRFRNSSRSLSEIKTRPPLKARDAGKTRSALAERSLSDQNIGSTASLVEDVSRSISDTSSNSVVIQGTVEQRPTKSSPGKTNAIQDTPEWRRRLIQGQVGYGEKRDLFSPMGLENIFQRPSASQKGEAANNRRGLPFSKGADAMPSSPPPWSPAKSEHEDSHSGISTAPRESSEIGPKRKSQERATAPESRTASGQLEFENESFSPVLISRNDTLSRRSYDAIPDLSKSEINERLRRLGLPPDDSSQSQSSLLDTMHQDKVEESSYARLQEDTLPENLPVGTPDAIAIGEFVSAKRGGYSADGSFLRRPLSPSQRSKTATSTSQVGESIAAGESITGKVVDLRSKKSQNSTPRSPSPAPVAPSTPHRYRDSEFLSPEKTRSSGSPLKLFGAHDTFTSNRLQRRLSQLEDRADTAAIQGASTTERGSPRKVMKKFSLTSVEEASVQKITIEHQTTSQTERTTTTRRETFGQGELDNYSFPDELSMASLQTPPHDEGSDRDDSPGSDIAPPGWQKPIRFHIDSPLSAAKARRTSSKADSVPGWSKSPSDTRQRAEEQVDPPRRQSPEMHRDEVQGHAEGKRPPTSPFKNPTPKRRRTLLSHDTEPVDESGMESVKGSHAAMQSIIGKKRKDARAGLSQNIADADVLARRHILRPRNPTPSQRRRDEIEAEIMEATEAFLLSSPRLEVIQEQINSPAGKQEMPEPVRATAVATEVAKFTLERTNNMNNHCRKRSVTTQDFLDEAMKIMEFIRTKGRPTSGLGSLEETESESQSEIEDKYLPSTPYTFSRPPSREGATAGWRIPNRQTLDDHVVDHLRKFQDTESDNFMTSSARSIRFQQPRGTADQNANQVIVEQNNIRITTTRNRDRAGSDLTQGHEKTVGSGPGTSGSKTSAVSSFGQTIATDTSRKSDHVATLAPQAVAHLIPQQIAGMSFDNEKGIWVKTRNSVREVPRVEDISALNESEDDPFGDIPDLTVDELRERVAKDSSQGHTETASDNAPSASQVSESEDKPRPVTREGRTIQPTDSSSVPSKYSNFAWSFPKTETRATSLSEPEGRFGSVQQKMAEQIYGFQQPEPIAEEVEHEIQFHEGRVATEHTVPEPKLRNITISFSSPQVSRTDIDADRVPRSKKGGVLDQDATDHYQRRSKTYSSLRDIRNKSSAPAHHWRSIPGSDPLAAPKIPPIEENGELSILPEPRANYRMQFSMDVSAPVFADEDALMPVASSPCKPGDVTFMLSELPEFTVNQIDERELPNRVVVHHKGQVIEDRYAQGTAELVKALQDVEPDEPYWEDLREVDIHEKGLTNLHRLDQFCFRIEDLEVSGNDICQLAGVPSSVRRLLAQGNSLTSLTSWGHLLNLQHLDISSNDIDSLKGLSGLIHLRTLKVDDNKVRSLEGILDLDGLMELNIQRNDIKHIDFDFANLRSLVELNVSGNGLFEVRNLQCLPRLQRLNLDDNCIMEFPVSDMATTTCPALRSLQLCGNRIETLELGNGFPCLESLHVDNNSLIKITGLDKLRNLRALSAREQSQDTGMDFVSGGQLWAQHSDVRSLYLSACTLPTFQLPHDFLNLQRLELASSGLQTLPSDFGQRAFNLRYLNLNFNALKDLRALLNIKRLNHLLLAGNRLARLRTNITVLEKLSTVSVLDLRDNPLTIGFYAPVVENRLVKLKDRQAYEDGVERFTLPAGSPEADQQYLARLDADTRLRRRVHEMMLGSSCQNLKELDGLPFDHRATMVRDEIWERLLYLGIIKKSEPRQNT